MASAYGGGEAQAQGTAIDAVVRYQGVWRMPGGDEEFGLAEAAVPAV